MSLKLLARNKRILELVRSGRTQVSVAREFGICHGRVSRIIKDFVKLERRRKKIEAIGRGAA